jgi:hypothetical protein
MPRIKGAKDLTRAYLLDALDGSEKDAVENTLFTDDAYLAAIEDAEEQLIEEYLRGTLSPNERTRFEEHFLASPRRRHNLELTRALIRIAAAMKKPEAPSRRWNWLTAFIPVQWLWRSLALAASLIAIVSLGLSGWLAVRLRQVQNSAFIEQHRWAVEREQARNQIAGLKRENASRVPQPAILSFVLAPGLFRDQNVKVLRISKGATTVQLKLQTDESLAAEHYSVTVRRETGAEIWRSEAAVRTSKHEAEISIPVTLLNPGRYLLTLFTPGASGVIDDYAFEVAN